MQRLSLAPRLSRKRSTAETSNWAKLLVERGADINRKLEDGSTMLMWAALAGTWMWSGAAEQGASWMQKPMTVPRRSSGQRKLNVRKW